MNPTNDPALRSWVPVAADSPFPIQNLPIGRFGKKPREVGDTMGVAIGDMVLDLTTLAHQGPELLDGELFDANYDFLGGGLGRFMSRGPAAWREARGIISRLLRADEPALRDNVKLRDQVLLPMSEINLHVPCWIHNYTDFYSSRQHATNVGIMLRGPDNALMPNWLHLPVAYHGRASSIVVSGEDIRRPCGQTKTDDAPSPSFGSSRALDFELQIGFFLRP